MGVKHGLPHISLLSPSSLNIVHIHYLSRFIVLALFGSSTLDVVSVQGVSQKLCRSRGLILNHRQFVHWIQWVAWVPSRLEFRVIWL